MRSGSRSGRSISVLRISINRGQRYSARPRRVDLNIEKADSGEVVGDLLLDAQHRSGLVQAAAVIRPSPELTEPDFEISAKKSHLAQDLVDTHPPRNERLRDIRQVSLAWRAQCRPMHPGISQADQLRTLERMFLPDIRNQSPADGASEALARHHDAISRLKLSTQVPETVAVQFETARNLCLYAWLVYRFYPVAEMQALAALEFGLRERFPAPLPASHWSNRKRDPTLHALLRYAADQGLIKNEGFSRWHAAARRKAHDRQEFEAFEAAIAALKLSMSRCADA